MAPSVIVTLAMLQLFGCALDLGVTRFNTSPEVSITSHGSGSQVAEGEMVVLRGSVSDPNHEFVDLNVQWFGGNDQLCLDTQVDQDGISMCTTGLAVDQGVIVLTATDPEGAAASATVTLEVVPGSAPELDVASPVEDAHYYSDTPVQFLAQVQDDGPAGDLVLTWESSLDGLLDVATTVDGSGLAEGYAELSEGDHQLTVTVTDGSGLTDSLVLLVEVGPPNSPPTCTIVEPVDGDLLVEGVEARFSAQVDDADVGPEGLVVTWQGDRAGVLGTSSASSAGEAVLSSSALSAGSHVVTLLVEDDQGEFCTDTVSIDVTAPPALTLTSPAADLVVNEGDAVSFAATATDYEDASEDLSVTFSSSLDGTLWIGSPDGAGNIRFTADGLSRGTHTITATATDTSDLVTVVTQALVVNGAPAAPVVTLGPSGADTTQDLVASISTEAVDPDGDSVSYVYSWYRDGTLHSIGSDTLSSSSTTRGESWSVVVTATDGWATGPAGTASLTIANAAPVVTAASLSPSDPSRNDSITASSSTTDPDGDSVSVSWTWYVDGSAVSPTSTSLSSSYFQRGDEVYAVARPSDGTATGSTLATASVVVVNAPPTVPSVSIDPDEPVELIDDLLCELSSTATDADGDSLSVSVAWTVDGDAYGVGEDSGASWSGPDTTRYDGDTVPADDTVEGQEWICTVTVTDGEDAESRSSAAVEVQGVFEFQSSQVIDGATVTCSSTTATTEYTECQDFQAAGLYLANGVGCSGSWTSTSSDYSDYAGLCESLTGSDTFEAAFLCSSVATRATWNAGTWGSRSDNGYTKGLRCYYP